ncbi:MAG: SURF1 family protein [Lysobacteraceae bacterium]
MKPGWRHRPAVLWAFALVAAGLFCTLGVWQLGRAEWKRDLLQRAAQALSDRRPKPLAVIGDTTRDRAYDWVDVEGRFVEAPAVLLDNQGRDGQVGVRAYRAFAITDGPAVLVDLGWVAIPGDRRMPAVPRDAARTRLTGLLLPPPSKGLALGEPAALPDGDLLVTWVDPVALRARLRAPTLAPRVLRPAPEAGFGFERDFDILPNTMPPERHVGYAVQWFALSATVLVTAVVLTLRRRRRAPGVPA